MMRVAWAFAVGALVAGDVGGCPPSERDRAGDPAPKCETLGGSWAYSVMVDGKVVDEGQLCAHDSKLYKGGKQIGTYAQNGKNGYKLDITDGKLKGKIDIVMTKSQPPTYCGACEFADGRKGRITITFPKD